MVVLGPLILIVLVLGTAIFAGRLLYPDAPVYVDERQPQLYYAHSPVTIYSGQRAVRRLEPGDSAWVLTVGGGQVVIHAGPQGGVPIGVAEGLLLPWRPRLPLQPYRSAHLARP